MHLLQGGDCKPFVYVIFLACHMTIQLTVYISTMYSTYVIRLVIGFVNTLYVYEVSTSLFRVKLHRELDVHDLLCGPNNCTLRMKCLCPTLSQDGIYYYGSGCNLLYDLQ